MKTTLNQFFESVSRNLSLHSTETPNKKTEIKDQKILEFKQDEIYFFTPKLNQENNSTEKSFCEEVKFETVELSKQVKQNKLKEFKLQKKEFKINIEKSTLFMKKVKIYDEKASKCMMKILHDYQEILCTNEKKVKVPPEFCKSIKTIPIKNKSAENQELKKCERIIIPINKPKINQIKREYIYTTLVLKIILFYVFFLIIRKDLLRNTAWQLAQINPLIAYMLENVN